MDANARTDERPGLNTEAGRDALLAAAARLKAEAHPEQPAEGDADGDTDGAPDDGTATDAEVDAAPAVAAAAKDDAKRDDKADAQGIAALKREQRRMNAEHEARQKELDDRESQIAEDMKAVNAVAAAADVFLQNPIPIAQSLGAKTADDFYRLGRFFYVQHARLSGKQIPPEWEQELRTGSNDVELRALKQQIAEQEKRTDERITAREREAFRTEYRAELKVAATAVDAEVAPHVATLMKHDANSVAEALLALADDMVRKGYKTVPEPDELIEIYEANLAKELAPFASLYDRKKQKTKGSKGTPEGRKPPATQITPNLSTQIQRGTTQKRSEEEKLRAAVGHLKAHMAQLPGSDDD